MAKTTKANSQAKAEMTQEAMVQEVSVVNTHTRMDGTVQAYNGIAITTATKNNPEKTERLHDFMAKLNSSLYGFRKSYIMCGALMYGFINGELHGSFIDPKTGKAYANGVKELEAVTGMKGTQINDMVNMFGTYYYNTEVDEQGTPLGIEINGHRASEYSQTQLIAMLPATKKEDERKAVFSMVAPDMKVSEVKEVVEKHHAKNERKKEASTKKVSCKTLLKAVQETMKDFAKCTDVDMLPQDRMVELSEAYMNFEKAFVEAVAEIERQAEANKKALAKA